MHAIKTGKFQGYHLKMIALVTMFIDHIAAVVIWRFYVESLHITGNMHESMLIGNRILVWVSNHQSLVYTIYEYMRLIGRMAFPIYCFLLVEGFLHTRSVKKYALRLLVFAFLSEIPFDLAIAGKWFSFEYSNVFFTLFLGLLLIWGISYVQKFHEFWLEKHWDVQLGEAVVFIIGAFLAIGIGAFNQMVLHADYGIAGVLSILVIYLFRKPKEMGFALSVLLLSVMSSSIEIAALLMLYPISKYDGTRGKNSKYIFYAFYPVHLLLLAFVCMIFGV